MDNKLFHDDKHTSMNIHRHAHTILCTITNGRGGSGWSSGQRHAHSSIWSLGGPVNLTFKWAADYKKVWVLRKMNHMPPSKQKKAGIEKNVVSSTRLHNDNHMTTEKKTFQLCFFFRKKELKQHRWVITVLLQDSPDFERRNKCGVCLFLVCDRCCYYLLKF